jgi:hypothetical protein
MYIDSERRSVLDALMVAPKLAFALHVCKRVYLSWGVTLVELVTKFVLKLGISSARAF